MPDASKKTLNGAISDVLCISDARQKATATRHLVAAWKDATLALGTQPGRNGQAALITHY